LPGGGAAGIFLSTMRHLTFYLTLFALLLAASSSAAQSDPPPPPPPSPDYSPRHWKEYVYEQDNIKFRFPVEPKITTANKNEPFGTVTNRRYTRQSFLLMEVSVHEFPAHMDLEKLAPPKELMDEMSDAGLAKVKHLNPRVLKEADVTVDGHPARFMHVETENGRVVRTKAFVVKNRMYFCYVEVRKGERHGSNFENDFEKVAMEFLDSVRLAAPAR
jgi:hypothetical protein